MMLGSPAVIPIIQQAGVLQAGDYATADVPGKNGPLTYTLGVHDDIVAFKAGGASHQAAIKEFLDFVYQDKWQLQFDNEYDLLPATQSAATTMAQNHDVLRVPRQHHQLGQLPGPGELDLGREHDQDPGRPGHHR